MHSLSHLEDLARLLHEVQRVKRIARRPGETEQTNTAEHTFEVVMMCWFIATQSKLDLDIEKVFTFALAHDLIEAYAGDTYIYDEEAKKTKAEREEKALQRLAEEFEHFPELIAAINEYESKDSAEAKFVYAVDKLIDPLNASLEEHNSIWKEYDVAFEEFLEYKDHKIRKSEPVVPYWELLVEKLKDNKDFFFKK